MVKGYCGAGSRRAHTWCTRPTIEGHDCSSDNTPLKFEWLRTRTCKLPPSLPPGQRLLKPLGGSHTCKLIHMHSNPVPICPAGYGRALKSGNCLACLAGSWSPAGTLATPLPSCTPCAASTTTPTDAATDAAQCTRKHMRTCHAHARAQNVCARQSTQS